MSPMVSFFACFVVLPAVGFAIIGFAVRSYFRPTSEKEKKTIVATLVLTGLLTYYLFTDKALTPPAPYAESNAAVLATVKEGDLVLCADPATGQVERAVLIHSVSPDDKTIAYGIGVYVGVYEGREVFEAVIFRSRFAKCKLSEPIRDPRLANERIGEIIRSGLNPPSPRK